MNEQIDRPAQRSSLWEKIKAGLSAAAPGERAWRGAAFGALCVFLLVLAASVGFLVAGGGAAIVLASILAVLLLVLLLSGLLFGLGWLAGRLPLLYRFSLLAALLAAALIGILTLPALYGALALLAILLITASLTGAGLAVLAQGGMRRLSGVQRRVFVTGFSGGLLLLVAAGGYLAWGGAAARPPLYAAGQNAAQIDLLSMPDPSQRGPYPVAALTYGSGSDKRRPEFGPQVDLTTPVVDGSLLVTKWSPLRTSFWGFGPEQMPLNGRVWFPQGEGPFPLVIAVHGNHPMEDYSDLGYAYLGELLASRGMIFVSVDENFLNSSAWGDLLFFSRLEKEAGARGWLLLEHLRLWRSWEGEPGNPFYRRVDLDKIALIGHSRGGEGAAVAAAFNRLDHYPNDATLKFDYGFNIRALVAIAPTDSQYLPSGVRVPLKDINYLLLHGAHDGDVLTMLGKSQLERLQFSGDDFFFKAAFYIYGANHGQFNSDWGNKDLVEPAPRLFNLRQLLPAQEQEQIAGVLIGAFMAATLQEETGYLPLFQDVRAGRHWLPETMILNEYDDSQTAVICDFEEDIDPATAGLPGGRLAGESLTRWREEIIKGKMGFFGFKGVFLGWDNDVNASASYTIRLPQDGFQAAAEGVLSFSLADAGEDPLPEHLREGRAGKKKGGEPQPIDLSIEVFDRAGNISRLPLSRYALLQPQIEGIFAKAAFMHFFPPAEPVFQTFDFPLAWFVEANPALDVGSLAGIRLVFDRTTAGVVILNRVGLR